MDEGPALTSTVADAAPSTRRRAVTGAAWTVLGYGGGRAVRLMAQLVLARLLVPADFGLWAIVGATLAGLQLFSDLGIGQSIIQNPRGDRAEFVNTAFTVQALRGFLLGGICLLGAAPIARLYDYDMLLPMLLVAALSPIAAGLTSTSIPSLTRGVELRPVMLLELGCDVAGACLAVIWALISPTAWALVAGNLGTTLALSLGSHLLRADRNRFAWQPDDARSILRFGAGIFISSATAFLAGQTESLVLGKLIDLATLGVIAIVLLVANLLTQSLARLTGYVLLPLLSEALREDRSRAEARFAKASRLALLGALGSAVALTLGGEPIFGILLDERYADAGWMFEIVSIRVVIGITASPMWCLLLAGGHTSYAAVGNSLRFALMLAGVITGALYYDVRFICWVLALSVVPDYLYKTFGLWRHFRPVLGTQILAALVVTVAIAICVWLG